MCKIIVIGNFIRSHSIVGIAFPISDRAVFRANYGRYWQPVELSNLYVSDTEISSNFLLGNFTTTGNAALKPERSTQYEIGVEQMVGMNAAIKLEGFYKESKDYLFLENRNNAQTRNGIHSHSININKRNINHGISKPKKGQRNLRMAILIQLNSSNKRPMKEKN